MFISICTNNGDGSRNHGSPYTGKVLSAASPDKHHAMLLQVVSLPRNICLENFSGREPHACDFTLCRVWFLGLCGEHLHDDAFPLWIVIEEGGFG